MFANPNSPWFENYEISRKEGRFLFRGCFQNLSIDGGNGKVVWKMSDNNAPMRSKRKGNDITEPHVRADQYGALALGILEYFGVGCTTQTAVANVEGLVSRFQKSRGQ